MKKITLLLIAGLLILTSCWKSTSTDIINPNAEYLYFFGATCPHCQELNRLAEEEDLYSKIAIEKREVYFNNENREIFLKLVEEIKPERDGVPFVYDKVTWEVAVGVWPALEMFKSRLNSTISPEEIINELPAIEEAFEKTTTWAIEK